MSYINNKAEAAAVVRMIDDGAFDEASKAKAISAFKLNQTPANDTMPNTNAPIVFIDKPKSGLPSPSISKPIL